MDIRYSSAANVYEHGMLIDGEERPESLMLIATTTLPIYSKFNLTIVDSEKLS